MTPILVPTLAELRIDLERLDGIRAVASVRNDEAPDDEELEEDWNVAIAACWDCLDQIAAVPAASLADMKVKAYAFDWSARLLGGEPYRNPTDGEEQIMRQLVAGLLDEKLATGGVASVDGRAA